MLGVVVVLLDGVLPSRLLQSMSALAPVSRKPPTTAVDCIGVNGMSIPNMPPVYSREAGVHRMRSQSIKQTIAGKSTNSPFDFRHNGAA